MKEHTASCEERIGGLLAELENRYTKQYAELDGARRTGDQSRAHEIENEMIPYRVNIRRTVRIDLECGRLSAAWLEAEIETNNKGLLEVKSVTLHLADWFEHARRELTRQDAGGLWRLAEYHALTMPEAELLNA
jgi:hypothetical protein